MAPLPFFLSDRKYERITDSAPNPSHKKNYKRIGALFGLPLNRFILNALQICLAASVFRENTSRGAIPPPRSLVRSLDSASPPCAPPKSYLYVYCFMYG